jgi:hypothetical protein
VCEVHEASRLHCSLRAIAVAPVDNDQAARLARICHHLFHATGNARQAEHSGVTRPVQRPDREISKLRGVGGA